MALTVGPFMFCDWEDMVCRSLLDQHLGMELHRPKRLSLPAVSGCLKMVPRRNHFDELRDMLDLATQRHESPRASSVDKDDFQVVVDVQHFKPEEIEVKVVDNQLVIAAQHEDKRDDHGWVSRQFIRKYQLPEDINAEGLASRLSSDGLLTIVAPKLQPLKDKTEKTLQIECTGKPFVSKKQEKPKTLEQNEVEEKPE